ncbi:hypothetical protein EV356DRAFT_500934 [Viridothelium virens]|uniref:Thioredoxin-like fold domain-containing protein n=1 Tax=Viridothelium virens TaxID=1048519 RepID=A0A6A6HAZ8_VIRVR|nr:hypothetical protein EV356DRAFT_500934 [Viridothelium virens]
MALAPKYAGLRLGPEGSKQTVHTLEFFLDYVCPFSAKMFKTLYTTVLPTTTYKRVSPNLTIIFRPQIQPWHPSSTLVHEAALAVQKVAPGSFWAFSEKLFEHQKDYFDVSVVNETRNKIYERLAKLAGSVQGVDEGKIFELLKISDKPGEDGSLNSGNGVTNDLKPIVKVSGAERLGRPELGVGESKNRTDKSCRRTA